MEMMIAPSIAVQNPRTSKPSNNPAEIHSINPLITKENSPSEIIINGNEKNDRIGFNMEFSRPKTIAAINADLKFLIVIPGKSAAVA